MTESELLALAVQIKNHQDEMDSLRIRTKELKKDLQTTETDFIFHKEEFNKLKEIARRAILATPSKEISERVIDITRFTELLPELINKV